MSSRRAMGVSEFKAKCLGLLDELRRDGSELIISKRGKPIARVVPIGPTRTNLRGSWRASARVRGDIVHIDWTSEFEANR